MKTVLQLTFTRVALAVVLLCFVGVNNASALTIPSTGGTYSIDNTVATGGSNFHTFTEAVAALNAAYSAGTPLNAAVTFNVKAGETFSTETFPLTINDNTNNPAVIFQTDGSVATHPLIASSTSGSGTNSDNFAFNTTTGAASISFAADAFVILNGTNNITINGIDLLDPYNSNTGFDVKFMDIGFYLARAAANDGCQKVTIENCNITLAPNTSWPAAGYQSYNSGCFGIIEANQNASYTVTTATDTVNGIHKDNNFYGNTISNVSGGIQVFGIAPSGSTDLRDRRIHIGGPSASQGNTITNFAGSVNQFSLACAIYTNFTSNIVIANNIISNSTGSDGFSVTCGGIYVVSVSTLYAYNNKIYNLNYTSSSGVVDDVGIFCGTRTNGFFTFGPYYFYNNFIGGLTTTGAASGDVALEGIGIERYSNVALNAPGICLYNNTVYINNPNAGINTAALNVGTNLAELKDFRNNIFCNVSTSGSGGYTIAYNRTINTLLTDMTTTNNSDYNLYYAGTPGANNLIYNASTSGAFPGTVTASAFGPAATAGTYQNIASTFDQHSYGTAPTFASTTGSASNFLNLIGAQNAVAGGETISTSGSPVAPLNITTDYYGTTRNAPPCIGADEITVTTNTIATSTISPTTYCANSTFSVSYTVVGTYTSGNTFSAQISDASGSFATPVTIGTVTSTTVTPITVTIPSSASGSGYRIRVVSSAPGVIGTDNGANLLINGSPTLTFTSTSFSCSNAFSTTNGFNSSATTSGTAPDKYSITFSSSAHTAGFTDVGFTSFATWPTLPTLVVPAATPTGTYTCTYTFQVSSSGCQSAGSPLSILINEVPNVSLGTNPSVCVGATSTSIAYTALTGSTPDSYTFTWNTAAHTAGFRDTTNVAAAVPLPGGGAPIYIPVPAGVATGTYSGTMVFRNYYGGSVCANPSPAYSFSVTVGSSPSAPIVTGATSRCIGAGTGVYTTASGATSYSWSVSGAGNSITSGTTNFATVTWGSGFNGTASVGVTASNTCGSPTGSLTVTVNQNPFAAISGFPGGCNSPGASLGSTGTTTNSGTISGYQWQVGGSPISGATNSTYTATSSGNYTLVAGSSVGCSATSTIAPVTLQVNPTATITGTLSGCVSPGVSLSASSSVAGSGTIPASGYQWQVGGGNIGGATSSGYTATASGNYTVVVTNSNNCTASSTASTVTANTNPTVIINPSPAVICSGGTSLAASGASTYVWAPSASLSSSTGATVLANPVSATTYTITGTNAATCTATTTVAASIATPLAGGAYTIGVDFVSVAAAIAKLNCDGIAGAVTFNVPANWTETFPAANSGLINIPVNNPTSTNTITFQKSGAGANPLITAGVGVSLLDGIILISGQSYIAFNGIDITDPNSAGSASIFEYGYALFPGSATVGCQHITIENCHVTMSNANSNDIVFGIYSTTNFTSNGGSLTISNASGANSNNAFFGNTILHGYHGVYLSGSSAATYLDQNNTIGVGGGNTITVGASNYYTNDNVDGIYTEYQNNNQISNNTVTASDPTSSSYNFTGIWNNNGVNSNVTISNNSVTVNINNASNFAFGAAGIQNGFLSAITFTYNTVNITGNTVKGTIGPNVIEQVIAVHNWFAADVTLNISGNTISNWSEDPSSGIFSAIYIHNNSNPVTGSLIISGNVVHDNNLNTASIIDRNNSGTCAVAQIFNNTMYNNTLVTTGGNGAIAQGGFIYALGSTHDSCFSNNIYGNTITGTGTAHFCRTSGLAQAGVSIQDAFFNNNIHDNVCSSTATMNGFLCSSTGTQAVYGNTIHSLTSAGGVITAINHSAGSTGGIYKNLIYDINTTGSSANPVMGINISGGTTTTVYNNFVSDIKGASANPASPTPGVTAIAVQGGTTANIYNNSVYLSEVSSTASHLSAALYTVSGNAVDIRNNIWINNSNESGASSKSIAFYNSTSTYTSVASTTNNNLLAAGGATSGNDFLFYNGTTGYNTLALYKGQITSPRETNAATGDPLFVNVSSAPYDLHLQNSGLLSPAINGGQTIGAVTDDIDGQTRPLGAAGKYDIGADEINELQAVSPSVTAGANPLCTNSSVTFSMPTISNATSYGWVLPGALGTDYTIAGSSTNNTITVTYLNAVSGNVTGNGVLVPTGSGYTYTGPASSGLSFSAVSQPTVTATNTPLTNSICLGDVITLGASGSGSSTYAWTPATGLSSNTGASVSANPVTSITYTLTATASNGCINTTTDVVTVKPLPPLVVTPNNAVCTGGTTATLVASGASTYTWSPTTNLTPSNGTTATETAQISALTIYTVTGTGTNGCSTNTQVPVATVAVGGTISAPFSIICSGTTKPLSVIGAAGHDYQWQISTDNLTWTNITGATNTTYTTAGSDGTTNKFYRLLAQSNSCWNVASTTAEVDVSVPTIPVTATGITDNSLTLNWSPVGTGNYTISYSGPTSATLTSVTPSKTITGLTANGTYSITVTQTGLACAASGTITGVNTLCAMPTGVTLSSPASSQILVSWTGVGGADYRVYYRPLFSYNTYFTKDVSNASSVLLKLQGNNNLYASTTYEVYVSRLDCPTTGALGQGTSPTNVTTLPTVSCATPSIDSVRSLCPVQIEVFLHPGSSPTNNYNIYIQRITPTILAVNSYGVTGNYFTINVPYSGDQFLIAAESKCTGGGLSALYVWPGNLTIKPLCSSLPNLVLSNPTCHGFTASWNADPCLSNSSSGYELDLRVQGTLGYNSYGAPLPVAPVGPNKLVNWATAGRTYQVFVRSIYNCNGYVTYGPASQTLSITTLSSGCRDEETQQPEETKPAAQQYAPNNDEVFTLYPNPNNGEFVADLSRYSNEEDAVRIEVINLIGQTVMTHLTTISGGHMSEFINLPTGTAAGTYIVRLTAGKNVYTTKINVSK